MYTLLHAHRAKSIPALLFLIFAALLLNFSDLTGRAKAAAVIQNSVPVTNVSAASFLGAPGSLAPDSIVAGFGTQLARPEHWRR
jgi:hypothetical protein